MFYSQSPDLMKGKAEYLDPCRNHRHRGIIHGIRGRTGTGELYTGYGERTGTGTWGGVPAKIRVK